MPSTAFPFSTRQSNYTVVSPSVGPFGIDFRLFSADGSDVEVLIDGEVVTPADYTITATAMGSDDPGQWTNGSLLFDAAISGALVIRGNLEPSRESQFQVGRGIPPVQHNAAFNRLVASIQDLWRKATEPAPIGEGSVTNSRLADMPADTFKMGPGGGGEPVNATPSAARAALAKNDLYADPLTDLGTQSGAGVVTRNSDLTAAEVYLPIFPTQVFRDNDQSVMDIPADATIPHVAAQGAYVRSASTTTLTVAYFGAGILTADNTAVWGHNILLQDAAERAAGTALGRILLGSELDFNVMNPDTEVIGVSAGGNSLVQSNAANAFIANSLSGAVPGLCRWTTGFWVPDGCAFNGLVLGALETSGSDIHSIPILMQYRNGSGVKKTVKIEAVSGGVAFTSDDTTLLLQAEGMALAGNLTAAGSVVSPNIIGGSGVSDDLILKPTYGAGDGTERVLVKGGNNGADLWTEFGPMGERLGARVLYRLIGANMNTTSDQQFEKLGTFTEWINAGNGGIAVILRTGACSSAIGGIYTAAAKGGQAIVAASQAYNALTTDEGAVTLTASAAGGRLVAAGDLFFSLSTAHGSAGTCDIYIVGVPLD